MQWRVKTFNSRAIVGFLLAMTFVCVGSVALAQEQPAPWSYISPRPGAFFVPPATTIALRHGDIIDQASLADALFRVVGSASGLHPGELLLGDDDQTVIFKPWMPFMPGEDVTVSVGTGIMTLEGEPLGALSFQFTIAPADSPSRTSWFEDFSTPTTIQREVAAQEAKVDHTNATSSPFVTVPDDFPVINVTVPASGTGDGYIFLSSYHNIWSLGATPYLLILDNRGEPVYYKRLAPGNNLDFKKQPNGMLTYYDRAANRELVLNSAYEVVETFQAGNGYQIDHHDFQLLPNGHALLMIWDYRTVDMSAVVEGGDPAATVSGLVIQELDTSKNVLFQWSSWDHFAITDTQVSLTTSSIAYVHGNSVELDTDGNILISNRGLDEVTKIDRGTGEVIWRWGGKRNQFTFVGEDGPFYGQHDARRLPNGNITLYDNREGQTPSYSRAVEFALDEAQKLATVVWQHRNVPDTYGAWLGNAQRLPNGNTIIGWGSTTPTLSEVTPEGETAFELTFGWPIVSYRAFRFPWTGTPKWPPALVMQSEGSTNTLYYSWNGATEVATYKIYAGGTPNSMTLMASQPKQSFEGSMDVSGLVADNCFFQVVAVDAAGNDMQASNRVAAPGCQTFLPYVEN